MVRKASSAGDLGSLLPYNMIVPLGQDPLKAAVPEPRAVSQVTPRKGSPEHVQTMSTRRPRNDSLQASPSPVRPAFRSSATQRPRQSSSSDMQSMRSQSSLLSPQHKEHSIFSTRKSSPRPGHSPNMSSEGSLQVMMQSASGIQSSDLDLGHEGATIILRSTSPVELDWKCVGAPGTNGGMQWELRIRKPDISRTPIPFSPSAFSNTPSLSPASFRTSSPSPTPATPAFRGQTPSSWTQKPDFSTSSLFSDPFALPADVSHTPKKMNWPPSPCAQDFSSGSDSPPIPSTPKRNGFVLPPGYASPMSSVHSPNMKSHFPTMLLTPTEESNAVMYMTHSEIYARSPPATPLSSKSKRTSTRTTPARPIIVQRNSGDASDEGDDGDWDGYADILEQANRLSGDNFFQPSGLMLVSPGVSPKGTSALAKRRLGNGKALELQLSFASPTSSPKQEVNEVSRWSETEGGESELDDDQSFDCDSRPTSMAL